MKNVEYYYFEWLSLISFIVALLFVFIWGIIRWNKGLNGFDIRPEFTDNRYDKSNGSWENAGKARYLNSIPQTHHIALFFILTVFLLTIICNITLMIHLTPTIKKFSALSAGLLSGFLYNITFYRFNLWISKKNSLLSFELAFLLTIYLLLFLSTGCTIAIFWIFFKPSLFQMNASASSIYLLTLFCTFTIIRFRTFIRFLFYYLDNAPIQKDFNFILNIVDEIDQITYSKDYKDKALQKRDKKDHIFLKFPQESFKNWPYSACYQQTYNRIRLRDTANNFPLFKVSSALITGDFTLNKEGFTGKGSDKNYIEMPLRLRMNTILQIYLNQKIGVDSLSLLINPEITLKETKEIIDPVFILIVKPNQD